MRLLVCGSRTYADAETLNGVLDGIHAETPVTLLVEGGARGADTLARRWAASRRVDTSTHCADWRLGKRAGPERNQQMLDITHPELVVAFVDKPLAESRGTAHMVRLAIDAGVPVRIERAEVPA